ncbi:MAG: ABC transporter substrate-binding protein [Deferrisomatales bacterium]
MKRMGWRVSGFLVGAALLLCPTARAGDTIKIGLVTPLSAPGDYESGQINVKTAELAVEELNAAGGVLGKKVELLKADDEGKPAAGVTAVKRLISQGVSALVGLWHSSVAVAQAKQIDRAGIPALLHYSWTDSLTESHSDYIFRVGPFNSEIANLLVPFLKQKGYKTVAVMYETTAFGTGFADALDKAAGSEGITVYKSAFASESTDFAPQLLELKGKNPPPELLVVATVYQGMYLIPKQAFALGLAPECDILASWDWPGWSPEWWEVMGEKGVGVMYATFESSKLKLRPLGEHFKEAFRTKYGHEPPVFAYFLYDEMMLLADAIRRAGSADPQKIAAALKDTRFEGTTGVITFERKEGPVWNQWTGHQLFVNKLTKFEQKGKDAEVIYP